MYKTVLIVIGDEILSGNTLDTNSQFIATQLQTINMPIERIITVSDNVNSIQNALQEASSLGNIIITTGGLGPTKDDKTKTAFQRFFNDSLRLDVATYNQLSKYLNSKGRGHLLEINKEQAMVLSKAEVIQNNYGTAPCMKIKFEDNVYFCLPGVPYEVKHLMKESIIPWISKEYDTLHYHTQTISVVNFPESLLAKHIESWELSLPKNMSISYLPIGNRIKLQLKIWGKNKDKTKEVLQQQIERLKPLISDKVISWSGNEIESILGEILKEKNMTIATAESCTGGFISHLITSVSGSSKYMKGGIVSYQTSIKESILKIPNHVIKTHGVVSEKVAHEMAKGAMEALQADIAVSTTGVAGPNSDEENNEIGKVCYCIKINENSYQNTLYFPHLDRKDFINIVSQRVLQEVVEKLTDKI